MCGILAIVETGMGGWRARDHGGRAHSILPCLAHRGPDARGTLQLERAWLGHQRLAIVDPHGSPQPFQSGSVACTANGEIYNHAQLRAEHGLDNEPGSDCAVIGPLWAKHGSRTPALLDGQFAFVAVDDATGHWIAARDHMGICPLYLGRHEDGTLWFASEMKALVDDCRHVELVEPGTMRVRDEQGVRCERWYSPAWMQAVPDRIVSGASIRETLVRAVSKRLMADVPWGVLLSGGVDSSIVASITARLARERGLGPINTFSIGLEGGPDLAPARRVAEFLGTNHHEFTFTLDEALAALPEVIYHLESYQQARTAVPTFFLAERIKKLGFKMVLSGEGADELFGGYLYFHKAPSPEEFHEETVRKTTRLHQYDVMRANKAPMAWGLELRFPYLDRDFVDLAMSLDPAERMIRPDASDRRIEKAALRLAFQDESRPWLPDDVLWRQKEQFSDGVGYGWVDLIRDEAARRLAPDALEIAAQRFPEDPPTNPEMHWMRELFEARFVTGKASGRSALATVGTGRSIACSTPEAIAWDPAWEHFAGDISGRAIAGVHNAGGSLGSGSATHRDAEAGSAKPALA